MSALNRVNVSDPGGSKNKVTVLSDTTYNVLKKGVQVVSPALASLYFGMSQIWGLPAGEEVVGTIALLTTFFGVMLGVSSNRYDESDAAVDGDAVVVADPGGITNVMLELNGDPELLTHQDVIKFKVKRVSA